MSQVVRLPPRLHRRALEESRERVDKDRSVAGKDITDLGQSPVKRHEIGTLGEFGFAEYYDLVVTTDIEGTDPGYDFRVEIDGIRTDVEVKTTTHEDGALLVEVGTVEADLYMLALLLDDEWQADDHPDGVEIELVGTATKAAVKESRVETIEKTGNDTYWIEQSDLQPLPDRRSVQPCSRG